ncbi:MAG: hypothetical protein QOI51_2545 [Nocardioidaceae bacterium]|jgi:hypothetical protein|nr:hypothetical protein [Nocardioidaceae bacterium]MDX6307861.1 hypothetical protein [Nocardioidaceae bacterium]
MITSQQTTNDIKAWFAGRLPSEWTATSPDISVDREEIVVRIQVPAPELEEGADESAVAEAAAGKISGWREETREARIAIAQEAERRFERKVSWGATVGDRAALFTHIAVPVMTRLRQPERQVLDTLVEAGVARSRSHALQWCVKLVNKHSDEWLSDLRSAMDQVHTVREQGPDA